MANRYWVGGTDNWDSTAGTKWSATSGGAGGETVPTSADDVFFDANSGIVTITLPSSSIEDCKTLNCTNFTGTIAGSGSLNIYGSLILYSGMTLTHTGIKTFKSTTTGNIITTAGKLLNTGVSFTGAGGGYTLQDDLNATGGLFTMNANNLSIDTNSKNIYSRTIDIRSGRTGMSLTLGSTIWTIDSTGTSNQIVLQPTSALSIPTNTAVFKINRASPTTTSINIDISDQTLYKVWIDNQASNASNTITTNNGTITNYQDDNTSAHITYVSSGKTLNVGTFIMSGTENNYLILRSGAFDSQFTLSCPSGTISLDYVGIHDCIATGGATFNTTNSEDMGNNSGWNGLTISDRYFVNNTQKWGNYVGTQWPYPTKVNDVFIDSNSGTGAIYVDGSIPPRCKTLDFTEYSGSFGYQGGSPYGVSVYGNITLSSTMTIPLLSFFEICDSSEIITNGVQIPTSGLYIRAIGGLVKFLDSFIGKSSVYIQNGTLDFNGYNHTFGSIKFDSGTKTLTMGSSDLTLVGSAQSFLVDFNTNSAGGIITEHTGTIKNTGTNLGSKTINFGGFSIKNFWDSGVGETELTILGSNTIENLKVSRGRTIKVTDGTTQTIKSIISDGSSGIVTLQGTGTSGWNLSNNSSMTVENIKISNCSAIGGGLFLAPLSKGNINAGSNSGWIFLEPNQNISVRAYAKNRKGTSYGSTVNFTTLKAENSNFLLFM